MKSSLGRNLAMLLENEGVDEVSLKFEEYDARIKASLHEVKGYQTISRDLNLLKEAREFCISNNLRMNPEFQFIMGATVCWHEFGTGHHSGRVMGDVILETVHGDDERYEDFWTYRQTVSELVRLHNNPEAACTEGLHGAVRFWREKGKLSKYLYDVYRQVRKRAIPICPSDTYEEYDEGEVK